jgi:hypothetical protein
MAATKTRPTDVAVEDFIGRLDDPKKREGSHALIELMTRVTGAPARMWGPSIVGFGSYHYKYASGHEGDSCLAGFSPRKAEFTIYLNGRPPPDTLAQREALLARLGRHRMGKGCLYVKRLDEIDPGVLEQLVRQSVAALRSTYPAD